MGRTAPTTSRAQRGAGALAIGGLGAAALLHAAWARGSTWPSDDLDQLTDLVVGRRASATESGFPDARASWMVAGLLSSAAGLTAVRAGLVPFPGGRTAWPVRVGTTVAASVLLARGAGGLMVSGLDLATTTPTFRRWNLRLYSPFCLALGAAIASVARNGASPL